VAGSHRVLVTTAVGLVELTAFCRCGRRAITDPTPEPTADRTAVLFGRRERLRRRRPEVVRELGRRRGDG